MLTPVCCCWPTWAQMFESLMRKFAGRPHWAKTFYLGAPQLRALFPRYDEFMRIRRESDPDGVFLNRYVESIMVTNGN